MYKYRTQSTDNELMMDILNILEQQLHMYDNRMAIWKTKVW